MTKRNNMPSTQRALVLGGGGALGAYEVGALKTLCRKLKEADKENHEEDRLLFDIVAGTSIGAMNGAVLVSRYLETENWEDETKRWEEAIKHLEKFWTEDDKGLASKIQVDILNDRWDIDEEWYKKVSSVTASKEAARRYYSAQYFFGAGTPRVNKPLPSRPDCKFFDDEYNKWIYIHTIEPLKESIQSFASLLPMATAFHKNNRKEPRLLIFSVDVLEGETVTFDSYPKPDGSRKSEYGKYDKKTGAYQHVIKYPGITIEHVMASGTLPEIYDYAEVHINQTLMNESLDKGNKNGIRYFWDGGLLSNTPFRELLRAHEDYWTDAERSNTIPDLEVYIVNLHPSKIDRSIPPIDHDGVKARLNDITFCDRNSHYDEGTAHLLSNYKDFVAQMKELANKAISKINDPGLVKELEGILETPITYGDVNDDCRKYKDLLNGRFKLKVLRVERKNDADDISSKVADFTQETIKQLIEKGEHDASNLFI
jgi:predicted acylesterase/phospholipase RssA